MLIVDWLWLIVERRQCVGVRQEEDVDRRNAAQSANLSVQRRLAECNQQSSSADH